MNLSDSSIACIPCDSEDYPGPLKAADTIDNVDSLDDSPGAIILYSASATHCNFSTDAAADSYQNIFTVLNLNTSTDLQNTFGSTSTSATISSMSSMATGVSNDPGSSPGSGGGPNTGMCFNIIISLLGIPIFSYTYIHCICVHICMNLSVY